MEVVAAKRRLQYQAERVRGDIPKVEQQAQQALGLGREDLARIALQRKQTALAELQGLRSRSTGWSRSRSGSPRPSNG